MSVAAESSVVLAVEMPTEQLVSLGNGDEDKRAGDDHAPLPFDGEEQKDLVVDDRDIDDGEDTDQESEGRPHQSPVLEPVHAEDRLGRMFAHKGVDDEDDQEDGEYGASGSTGLVAQVLREILVAVDTEVTVEVTPHDDNKVGQSESRLQYEKCGYKQRWVRRERKGKRNARGGSRIRTYPQSTNE